MTGVLDYSSTAASNTAINGIAIQGSNVVSNFDDALRQIMADIASGITSGYFAGAGYVAKSSGYTVLGTDRGKLIDCTAGLTLSLTAAATIGSGFYVIVKANGGDVTIDPNSTENINGSSTSYVIPNGSWGIVICTGSAWHTVDNKTSYKAGGTDVALADGGTGASLADPNADRIMFWDDSAGSVAWLALAAGLSISGTTLSPLTYSIAIQSFTASGTYTPATGMTHCLAIATGSGGGGGGADSNGSSDTSGSGGGAGGTAIGVFSAATIGASQAVTIGAAGTAGAAAGGGGGNGGNTTFGALLTGGGGSGGSGSGSAPGGDTIGLGGTGGTASSGTINIDGGSGAAGYAEGGATGGVGGASFWGGGGRNGATYSGLSAGAAGQAYGSGGGGAADVDNTTGEAGGAGKAGIVVVLELVAV